MRINNKLDLGKLLFVNKVDVSNNFYKNTSFKIKEDIKLILDKNLKKENNQDGYLDGMNFIYSKILELNDYELLNNVSEDHLDSLLYKIGKESILIDTNELTITDDVIYLKLPKYYNNFMNGTQQGLNNLYRLMFTSKRSEVLNPY